jgi:hypothetical protein
VAGLVGDQLEHDQAQVAVVEEPAHAAPATVLALMAVEAERVTAVMAAMVTHVTAVMLMMTSKHCVFSSYFVISKMIDISK